MEGTNRNSAGTGAGTPIPAVATAAIEQPLTSGNGSKPKRAAKASQESTLAAQQNMERARFMPIMDIQQAVLRRQMIVDATQKLMKQGVDYGRIPGTERDVLLQPGADKLCNLFGLVVEYETDEAIEDWRGAEHDGEPFFYYKIRGRAYRGNFLMGEGVGSCNSWESKYRWRNAERTCPSCNRPNIRKSREGGWFCWAKTGGCGANFPIGAAAIESQQAGRKANPDAADVVNTVLKMAYKRAKVATTINATSASEFFTQDVEDFAAEQEPAQAAGPQPVSTEGVDTGGHAAGAQAANYVAQQKLEALKTTGEIRRAFAALRERIGELGYLEVLERHGVRTPDQFRSTDKARACYRELAACAAKEAA
jgi:ribosomal protein L37AE/L43A